MQIRRKRAPVNLPPDARCVACRLPCNTMDLNTVIHPDCQQQIIDAVARESRPGYRA